MLRGNSACPGCQANLALRHVLRACGADTILILTPGCSAACQGIYPDTCINVPVLNTAFAAGASTAIGVAASTDSNVVVYAGDGATADIGLASLSFALEYNTDFLYICYDNEAYGNTGAQRSGTTPYGARTTTTPGGKRQHKKDIDSIVCAHQIPYMATAAAAYPDDLYRKVKKALSYKGSKFIHVLTPCPTLWGFPQEKSAYIGKLAIKTGAWVLYEKDSGKISISLWSKNILDKYLPLEDYLKAQSRFSGISDKDILELKRNMNESVKRLVQE